ncbi:fungal-specific transcription factor domain-containing protein [Roridomyces roridus]|uniref:Fungal-specific transcription factor domain-containing protein n=1 Tax=Roridomyces roridus TaxID=1738132 RepID=A0AAD7FSG6_9AGAR|nr:fungal-specific transcription factor domain-containing protein [Roridomyces roridus]
MQETATGSTYSSNGPRKSQVTSCAECRRLKLRCDRVFPCSSCMRRGCANLCPTGTLEKGKRGFLKRLEQSLPSKGAGDEHTEVAMFVARDSAMSKRIQELEAALSGAGIAIPGPSTPGAEPASDGRAKRPRTSSFSDSVSPTLAPPRDKGSTVDTNDVTLGLGTLTIDSVDNRSRYIGPSGGASYLASDLWKVHRRRDSEDVDSSVTRNLDFGIEDPDRSRSPIETEVLAKMSCLPPRDEAVRIATLYFKNASFMYEIIPEDIFFNDRLPAVYPDAATPCRPANLHVLSLCAIVLALGAFFDLSVPSYQVQHRAEEFYDLAAVALNISLPLSLDTIPAVQTLHLMVLYFLSTRGESGGESAWQLLGMAMRSLQAQGCHRDGARWGLSPRELEERRRVFWETHIYDRLQSFTFGRPYALGDAHHDCEMPQSSNTPLPSDTDPTDSTWSYTRWHHHKFRFAFLLGRIVDLGFSAKHPTYSVIMQLDREINEHYDKLPAWMIFDAVKNPVKELASQAAPDADLRKNAQLASLANMYFLTLLHLHRGPFCRVLMLGQKHLIDSPYSASIKNLVGAARAIINIVRGLYALHPALTSRMWYWIFHSFTAAVCQAVLVILAPSHPLSPAAFESMQAALELYERADGERAKSAAIRLGLLAGKARATMEAYRLTQTVRKAPASGPADLKLQFPTSNIRGNPEDLLGMTTKLIRTQTNDSISSSSSMSPSSSHSHSSRPMSNEPGTGGYQFGSDAPGPGFQFRPPGNQNHWIMGSNSSPNSVPLTPAVSGRNIMDWTDFSSSNVVIHSPNPQPAVAFTGFQHMPATSLDPSLYLSVDGFDLSGFIQSGANAWMFDRSSEMGSDEDLRLHETWPAQMRS